MVAMQNLNLEIITATNKNSRFNGYFEWRISQIFKDLVGSDEDER